MSAGWCRCSHIRLAPVSWFLAFPAVVPVGAFVAGQVAVLLVAAGVVCVVVFTPQQHLVGGVVIVGDVCRVFDRGAGFAVADLVVGALLVIA